MSIDTPPPFGTPEYERWLLASKLENGLAPCGKKTGNYETTKRHIIDCPLPPCQKAKAMLEQDGFITGDDTGDLSDSPFDNWKFIG